MKKKLFFCIVLFSSLYFGVAIMANQTKSSMNELTPEEERIIINKGTEAPYSGDLLQNKQAGVYICKRCGQSLYKSEDKFDSRCGWPSFDDAIKDAVIRKVDADGRRTEILCASCGGHLGHVFEGEGFTKKDTRHCVNSISMRFVEENKAPQYAYFAGGCFWGIENEFSKLDGVLDVISGYMGGSLVNPSYEQVSTGKTGHAEAVRIAYDPEKISYEQLAKLFFEIHDPTQLNYQGVDKGTQYRSAVFYTNKEQKITTDKLIDALIAKGWNVVTELNEAGVFYHAEDYHQDFTERTGRGACHFKIPRFDVQAK